MFKLVLAALYILVCKSSSRDVGGGSLRTASLSQSGTIPSGLDVLSKKRTESDMSSTSLTSPLAPPKEKKFKPN